MSIIDSITLQIIQVIEIGLYLVDRDGLPFLKIGHTIAVFQIFGITLVDIDNSKRIENGMAIVLASNFRNKAGKPSGDFDN